MPDRPIWQTESDSYRPLSMKQNVWFQGGICTEKIQVDQIQNGQLEAIIDFDMGNK